MSPTSTLFTKKLVEPAELEALVDDPSRFLDLLFAHLNPEGKQRLWQEMEDILHQGSYSDLTRTVRAWYYTLLCRQDPNYLANVEAAMSLPLNRQTRTELKAELGLG